MSVVVGYVPTKEGRAALRRAAEESRLRHLPLIVVHSERTARDRDSSQAQEFAEEMQQVQATLDAAGVEHEERNFARDNEPAEDLIAVADETDAAVIVIGLRRRTPVGKLLLGSNAQRILLEASCPVLAVKASED